LGQDIDIHRFFQIGKGAKLSGQCLLPVGSMAGQDNNLHIGMFYLHPTENFDTINARHIQIENHDLGFLAFHQRQCLLAIIGHGSLHLPGL
jgi:hypothetical protein